VVGVDPNPADALADPRRRFRHEIHCTAAALVALATAIG
jgi:hypothetical protein